MLDIIEQDTTLYEHRFRAMNTDVAAWIWSTQLQAEAQLGAVEDCFAAVEDNLSRFRPHSELSRLNAAAGKGPVPVSSQLFTLLSLALDHARASGGIFDPTVLNAMQRAGYDRSFEQVTAEGATTSSPVAKQDNGGWRRVVLDPRSHTVTLPADMGIDLGGIAKGWTVDQTALRLGAYGPALVDAGGDMRATASINGECWPVAVQDPFHPTKDLLVLRIANDAVATSSIGKRRWQRNGRTYHHLIDPRTQQPAETDLHSVTVLAPTTVEAEIAAKVALILGSADGVEYLKDRHLSAFLVDAHGGPIQVGSLPVDICPMRLRD
ncbi:MAG: FAD:protein FMN transferase [Caldilineaceae bacterium]|nr:FAD:protein FMN transferase [Caldilineaceae bacterium]